MTARYEFFLPMIPPTVTAQQHRFSAGRGKKAQVYDSPALHDAREKLTAYLGVHKPPCRLMGPVRLVTKWIFPMTQGSSHGQYKATRPDTDNLVKLFKDCMTKTGFWYDDAQVASETIEKFYGNTPGIFVFLEELEEDL